MKKNYLKIFNIFENHLISVKTTKVLQYLLMTIYLHAIYTHKIGGYCTYS